MKSLEVSTRDWNRSISSFLRRICCSAVVRSREERGGAARDHHDEAREGQEGAGERLVVRRAVHQDGDADHGAQRGGARHEGPTQNPAAVARPSMAAGWRVLALVCWSTQAAYAIVAVATMLSPDSGLAARRAPAVSLVEEHRVDDREADDADHQGGHAGGRLPAHHGEVAGADHQQRHVEQGIGQVHRDHGGVRS